MPLFSCYMFHPHVRLFYLYLQIIGLLNVFTPQKTLEEFQDV